MQRLKTTRTFPWEGGLYDMKKWIKKPMVVMCHTGVRSAKVCQYLESLGYNVKNLKKGGGDAWSILVDSTEPRY
ncbi:MAG TPA: hypothetical protein EYO27_02320 [Candidatus Marinimicrobia bacterium]|nr:hypothetical protein [Candidatus Neomarinimicrobiota bacterium]